MFCTNAVCCMLHDKFNSQDAMLPNFEENHFGDCDALLGEEGESEEEEESQVSNNGNIVNHR